MTTEVFNPVDSGLVTNYKNPRFFGPENGNTQETFMVDEPLVVTPNEYLELKGITGRIVNFISKYGLRGKEKEVGVSPDILEKALEIDRAGFSFMRYGGLDVYKDPDQGFKVLEINPRVQAMGLQDYRQEALGIENQPQIINDFLEWVHEVGYKNVLVLGSRQNPFWRAYEKLTDRLLEMNVNAGFYDAGAFLDKYENGFVPDLILKFCNNSIFLDGEFSGNLQQIISANNIPLVNPLHSAYFGYRGFLGELSSGGEGNLFPEQKVLSQGTCDIDLQKTPWIKLEAAGNAYVVNYQELRKWGRDVLVSLINGNIESAEKILEDKNGGDAKKLKDVIGFVRKTPSDQVVWLAQSNLAPLSSRLKVMGIDIDLKILHRVYWFKKHDGDVSISLEGFGCTNDQFRRSKGKINGGSGFAIPMVIK